MHTITTPAEELYKQSKHKHKYIGFYQTVVKRALDIIFSLLSLPFLLIFIVVFGLAIKFEDHGSIFYRSMRLGKDFKEFGMLKFRTMSVNAPDLRNDDGSTFNSDSDPRVTKIGRFLRRNSIDEIPQVLNVLIGQMSIIGPRAGDVESKSTYSSEEKDKLLVRPGITGYTQAYYRNSLGVHEKRLYDAYYAHNVSFCLDIKILLRTFKTVFFHENIYTNR